MRIYLAGKIGSDDWRTRIVFGLEEAVEEILLTAKPWPILKSSIHGIHDYTGPFFQKVDKTSNDTRLMHPHVHEMCLRAIDASDVVYAWVDDLSCYATLYELGYAKKAGKYVIVAYPPSFNRNELWFINACSDLVTETRQPDIGLVSVLLEALRSGHVPHRDEELQRVQQNLSVLQRMMPRGPDEVREARKARGQHVAPSTPRNIPNPTSQFPPERVTARTSIPEAPHEHIEKRPDEGDDRE